jgi:4-amino-4-deoxy-L-arabinose transferase-like glycosyltransferase
MRKSWVWITIAYFLTHLPSLTLLPVFADEAIYIRWAQLIIDEPLRFAFFSMSDGKPPLFMWILSLTLRAFPDPLLAGRFTAVLIGFFTMFIVAKTARLLTGSWKIELLSAVMVMVSPFWWFYHRMALMDGLLTLFIALSFYFALRIAIRCQKERGIAYDTIPLVLLLGTSFGGALLTKTPALFAIPIIAITPLFSLVKIHKNTRTVRQKLIESIFLVAAGGLIGCIVFLFLRVSPFFGTLFARSGDFTFTIHEVLNGEWRFVLLSSLPREISWLSSYLTVAVILMAIFGLFTSKKRMVGMLLLSALLFALPLIGVGRVLYPRYFLPIAPFLTIAAAIGIEVLLSKKKTLLIGWIGVLLFAIQSLLFVLPSLLNVSKIPFVAIDRMQYLEEWSAGFGNTQVRDFIRQKYALSKLSVPNRKPSIIVLTEGAFGTLPDGLLMYFYGSSQLDGVEIHGIGVGPKILPAEYLAKHLTGSDVYYMVNSHRYKIEKQDQFEKVLEVKRPDDGPSLLLLRLR